jgi:hypothetical protein
MQSLARLTRSWPATIGLCVALAFLSDVLFFRHVLGWSTGLFLAAALLALTLKSPSLLRRPLALAAAFLTLLLAAALIIQPTTIGILLSLLLLATTALLARGTWSNLLLMWLVRGLTLGARGPVQPLLDAALALRWWCRHPRAPAARTLLLAALWTLPIAAGLLFLSLFAIANPVIGLWLHRAWDNLAAAFDWLPQLLLPTRVALWLIVAWAAYALLRYRQPPFARTRSAPVAPPRATHLLPAGLIIRALLVVNAVFALETALDLFYLWGRSRLPAGMTYAAYAHRGAYTLIATALLAGALVLITFRRGGAAARSPIARRLVFLWIAQNLFLLASTLWRLWLYIDAYSLTRWRIASLIWVLLVAAGFGWLVAKIVGHRTNAWLWRMNTLSLLAVLTICAFCNFDGWIAAFNVRHCREIDGQGAPLDVAYLRQLGPAALPAIEWVGSRIDLAAVDRDLRRQLDDELADWRGWTLRRAHIRRDIALPLERQGR